MTSGKKFLMGVICTFAFLGVLLGVVFSVRNGTNRNEQKNINSEYSTLLRNMKEELDTSVDTVASLNLQVVANSDTIEELNTEIESYEAEITRLNASIGNYQTLVTQKENVITEKNNTISALNNTIEQKNALISELQTSADGNIAEIEQLESEIDELELEVASLESEVDDLESQVSTLTSSVSVLQGQVNTKNSEISSLESQVSAKTQEIATLNATISSLNEEISTLSLRITLLETELENATFDLTDTEFFDILTQTFFKVISADEDGILLTGYVSNTNYNGLYYVSLEDYTCTKVYTTGYNWSNVFTLSNGDVLIASDTSNSMNYGILLFDRNTMTVSSKYSTGARWSSFVELANGNVLITCDVSTTSTTNKTLLYNATTKTISEISTTYYHWSSSTALPLSNGDALIYGCTTKGVYMFNSSDGIFTQISSSNPYTFTLSNSDLILNTGGVYSYSYNSKTLTSLYPMQLQHVQSNYFETENGAYMAGYDGSTQGLTENERNRLLYYDFTTHQATVLNSFYKDLGSGYGVAYMVVENNKIDIYKSYSGLSFYGTYTNIENASSYDDICYVDGYLILSNTSNTIPEIYINYETGLITNEHPSYYKLVMGGFVLQDTNTGEYTTLSDISGSLWAVSGNGFSNYVTIGSTITDINGYVSDENYHSACKYGVAQADGTYIVINENELYSSGGIEVTSEMIANGCITIVMFVTEA